MATYFNGYFVFKDKSTIDKIKMNLGILDSEEEKESEYLYRTNEDNKVLIYDFNARNIFSLAIEVSKLLKNEPFYLVIGNLYTGDLHMDLYSNGSLENRFIKPKFNSLEYWSLLKSFSLGILYTEDTKLFETKNNTLLHNVLIQLEIDELVSDKNWVLNQYAIDLSELREYNELENKLRELNISRRQFNELLEIHSKEEK